MDDDVSDELHGEAGAVAHHDVPPPRVDRLVAVYEHLGLKRREGHVLGKHDPQGGGLERGLTRKAAKEAGTAC